LRRRSFLLSFSSFAFAFVVCFAAFACVAEHEEGIAAFFLELLKY
jgi:hypothetical protein